jgi:hypothetical protein
LLHRLALSSKYSSRKITVIYELRSHAPIAPPPPPQGLPTSHHLGVRHVRARRSAQPESPPCAPLPRPCVRVDGHLVGRGSSANSEQLPKYEAAAAAGTTRARAGRTRNARREGQGGRTHSSCHVVGLRGPGGNSGTAPQPRLAATSAHSFAATATSTSPPPQLPICPRGRDRAAAPQPSLRSRRP